MNILANINRGAGNMTVSAADIFVGEACHLILSPSFILGLGPFPRLGVSGAALGALSAYAVGSIFIGGCLCSRFALLRARFRLLRLSPAETYAISRIGAPAAASVVIFWAVSLFAVTLIGRLGQPQIAAYGIATRLDLIQYPIIFAFSSSIIALISTSAGAGDWTQCVSIARTGCMIGGMIGCAFSAVGFAGTAWMGMFSEDNEIIGIGAAYLHCQALIYPLFAAGLAAANACYGVGLVRLPLLFSIARCLITVGGGWVVVEALWGVGPLFSILAASAGIHGATMVAVLFRKLRVTDPATSNEVNGQYG